VAIHIWHLNNLHPLPCVRPIAHSPTYWRMQLSQFTLCCISWSVTPSLHFNMTTLIDSFNLFPISVLVKIVLQAPEK
jgi:hypothetical protein